MPSVTFAPAIYKQYRKKDGTIPVRIRVTFNRKTKIISTNIVARPDQLTRDYSIKDVDLMMNVQALISDMRAAANRLYFLDADTPIDEVVRRVVARMNEGEGFSLDFIEYGRKIADEKPKASRVNYMCALHSLQEFLGVETLDISLVNSSTLRKYEKYLRGKYGDGARAVSLYIGAIAHIHRRAQGEFNNEESGEIRIRNPFSVYTPPKQKAAPHRNVYPDLIRTMLRMRGELRRLERFGVDMYLLSFGLMGMNVPDLYSCAPPKDGVIVYNRAKTKDRRDDKAEMHVRIEPVVASIADEYRDATGKRAFCLYRRYDDFHYVSRAANNGLAQFKERIGYGKPITMYSARHTWASVAYSAGVDKSVINDCLCHIDPDMKVTDIYIGRDWSVLWKANAKVLRKVGWV